MRFFPARHPTLLLLTTTTVTTKIYALKVKPPKTATVESMPSMLNGVFGSDCGSSKHK